jgi:hypothetical protein
MKQDIPHIHMPMPLRPYISIAFFALNNIASPPFPAELISYLLGR